MSTDRAVREAAENELARLSQQEPSLLLYLLQYCARDHTSVLGPSSDPTVARNVYVSKLGAAIRFRNVVTKSDWNRIPYFTGACKREIRGSVVQLLCQPHVDDKIRKQLAAATKALVAYDYITGAWAELPGYLNGVLSAVQPATAPSRDGSSVAPAVSVPTAAGLYSLFGMLTVARHTCKVYENPTLVTPRATDEFASFMVPMLLHLSRQLFDIGTLVLVAVDPHRADRRSLLCMGELARLCAGCQRLTLKCLSSIILPRWPLVLCDAHHASSLFAHVGDLWTLFCSTVLPKFAVMLAHASLPMVDDAVRHDPQWKLGKWIGKVSDRLIELLGVPSQCEKRVRPAAKQFVQCGFPTNAATAALSCILWHDDRVASGRFLTSKLLVLCIELVEHVTVFEAAYTTAVLPHVEPLLTAVLPARLSFTPSDEELWTCNPEDYVRQLSDPKGDLYSPKVASMSLIVSLCIPSKPFHSTDLLLRFIHHMLHVLQTHHAAAIGGGGSGGGSGGGQPQTQASHRAVDGCLFAVTNLKRCLSTADFGDAKVEWLLVTYVSPLLGSPCGFLRARAVFTLSQFANIAWQDGVQHFHHILRSVLAMLDDPETPVRIQAASSLSRFIRLEISRPVVTPVIATIVEKYFVMMRQADHDGVIRTLRKTIKFYGETLTSWAVQLCEMLVQQFYTLYGQIQHRRAEIEQEIDRNRASATNEDADDDDDLHEGDVADALQAGDELIATLETLVECVPTHHDATTMVQLQEVVVPMLVGLMQLRSEGAFGFMDSVLQLLTTLIARSPAVAPVTWKVVETLHQLVADGATDYFAQLLAPLDNMLSVDPSTFCCAAVTQTGNIPAKLVLGMCRTVLQAAHLRCREVAAVPCIADAITLHTKQLIHASPHLAAPLRDELVLPFVSMALGALGSGSVTVQTLKVLFAGNVLAAMWAMPHDTVAYLVSLQALDFFVASYVALVGQPSVLHALREYDIHLFVLAVGQLMLVPAASGCVASLFQSPLLMHLAKASSARYEGEIKARKDDTFAGGDDDDQWDGDDDEDTDSDGDCTMGDEDDGEADDELLMGDGGNDDDIEDDEKFQEVLATAAAHREADLDEDPDENLLDDDDFTSPIDDLSPWELFIDAAQRITAPTVSAALQQQGELASVMHATAALWRERLGLRQAQAASKEGKV